MKYDDQKTKEQHNRHGGKPSGHFDEHNHKKADYLEPHNLGGPGTEFMLSHPLQNPVHACQRQAANPTKLA